MNKKYPGGLADTGLHDPINRPAHYIAPNGMEVEDVIEAFNLGWRLGNVVKYVLRADRKGADLEDLQKARRYLNREIAERVTRE